MQLLAKGKQKAFEILYDRYFAKLVHFATARIGNIAAAEDLVQEIFIGIIQHPEKFDCQRRFNTWLYTVANNACKNWYRNHQIRSVIHTAQGTLLPVASTQSSNSAHDQQILKQRIRDSLAHCSEKEQIIYTLRFEEEKQLHEIAEILSIPIGSVKSCLFYLLKKLATPLKEFEYATK